MSWPSEPRTSRRLAEAAGLDEVALEVDAQQRDVRGVEGEGKGLRRYLDHARSSARSGSADAEGGAGTPEVTRVPAFPCRARVRAGGVPGGGAGGGGRGVVAPPPPARREEGEGRLDLRTHRPGRELARSQ